jgi:2-phosphosulfolactate phosphatase
MTTTNGTKALLHCRQAGEVFAVALVNRAAVCQQLARKNRVDLVCAGSDGHIAQEDVLCAGAIVAALGDAWQTNDEGAIARAVWHNVASGPPNEFSQRVLRAFGESRGGRNLIDVGLASDLPLAAALDTLDVVPSFDPAAGRITLLASG